MYENKKILILGAAKSGIAVAKLLVGKNNEIILETKNENNPYTKYRILYISKDTGKPTRMEIKDNSKKTLIYILYKEVKFK